MTGLQRQRWALFEVLLFNDFVVSCIWGGESIRPPLGVIILILVGICVASNRYHGDTLERLGLRRRHFWPAFRALMKPAGPVILALYTVAAWRGMKSVWTNPWSYAGYPIWALAQDYTLLSFVGNRLEDALPNRRALVPWINGLLFAVDHLPNPLLTVTTLVAGVLFTHVFLRHRHLLPMVIVHALVGAGLTLACYDVPGILSVGPAYLERVGSGSTLAPQAQAFNYNER